MKNIGPYLEELRLLERKNKKKSEFDNQKSKDQDAGMGSASRQVSARWMRHRKKRAD